MQCTGDFLSARNVRESEILVTQLAAYGYQSGDQIVRRQRLEHQCILLGLSVDSLDLGDGQNAIAVVGDGHRAFIALREHIRAGVEGLHPTIIDLVADLLIQRLQANLSLGAKNKCNRLVWLEI